MVMYIKANGKMIRHKDKVFIYIMMEQGLVEHGKKTNNKVMEDNIGQTNPNMKAIIKMERKTGKGNFNGEIIQNIKDNFLIMIFMVLENINGMMVGYILDNGNIIKCMEKAHFNGLMAKNILGIILKTKNKEKANSIGLKEKNSKGNGKMESSMELVSTLIQLVFAKRVNGQMERE